MTLLWSPLRRKCQLAFSVLLAVLADIARCCSNWNLFVPYDSVRHSTNRQFTESINSECELRLPIAAVKNRSISKQSCMCTCASTKTRYFDVSIVAGSIGIDSCSTAVNSDCRFLILLRNGKFYNISARLKNSRDEGSVQDVANQYTLKV